MTDQMQPEAPQPTILDHLAAAGVSPQAVAEASETASADTDPMAMLARRFHDMFMTHEQRISALETNHRNFHQRVLDAFGGKV